VKGQILILPNLEIGSKIEFGLINPNPISKKTAGTLNEAGLVSFGPFLSGQTSTSTTIRDWNDQTVKYFISISLLCSRCRHQKSYRSPYSAQWPLFLHKLSKHLRHLRQTFPSVYRLPCAFALVSNSILYQVSEGDLQFLGNLAIAAI